MGATALRQPELYVTTHRLWWERCEVVITAAGDVLPTWSPRQLRGSCGACGGSTVAFQSILLARHVIPEDQGGREKWL